jgi:hypothetical protein
MKHSIFVLIIFGFCSPLLAEESECERKQQVIAQAGTQDLGQWVASDNEIHSVRLTNGFDLGVQISDPSKEFYSEFHPNGGSGVETVELVTFDMKSQPPRQPSKSYAGTNSIQGPNLSKFGASEYTLTLLTPSQISR